MGRIAIALFLIAVSAGLAPAQRQQERSRLESVSVHLFLTKSGNLSTDVTAIEGFYARNFSPVGKGVPDDERFYAVLVKVRLAAPKEMFAKGTQAEVVVTNRSTKKVVRKEAIADVFIGGHGWTIMPVFLPDAACGPFDIVVSGGGRKIAKALEVTCGE